ncbi:MAG: carbon storage regulator, partial [bacterium]|nr:carbon storage regulator [bacterium]
MLIFKRKKGECIRIGNHIQIIISEVRAGTVSIGIEAPADVKIHRDKVYRRIR